MWSSLRSSPSDHQQGADISLSVTHETMNTTQFVPPNPNPNTMKPTTRTASILTYCLAWLTVQSASAFYNPQLGRWANRDPIGERGGVNVYSLVNNGPVNWLDSFGRAAKNGPPVTPLPPLPNPQDEQCTASEQQAASDALKKACDNVNHQCFSDCMGNPAVVSGMKSQCSTPGAIKFRCPKKYDPICDEDGVCAYQLSGTVTLCGFSFDPKKCDSLECTMIHELAHAGGAPGSGPDSGYATKAEKCFPGCSGKSGPHVGEVPIP